MDVVVTVPKELWSEWLCEGDLAADNACREPVEWEGEFEYGFNIGKRRPDIVPGDRVYVVAHGHLRGYAPLVEVEPYSTRFGGDGRGYALVRRGGAVACTLPGPAGTSHPAGLAIVKGFRGFRYRWWRYEDEIPFPAWRREGVA